MPFPISIDDQALLDGFIAQRDQTQRAFTVIADDANIGQQFNALISSVPSIEFSGMMGIDPRYSITIEVHRDDDLDLESQAIISDGVSKWTVLKREDNAGSITIKYWCAQVDESDTIHV